MKRVPHTVNRKLVGMWCETESGHRAYIGYRTPRQIHSLNIGWCIDVGTLNRCRVEGIFAVGIVCKRKGVQHIWLTHVEDFFDPARSFPSRNKLGAERGIRLAHFRIDPAQEAGKIDRQFSIR